MLCQKKILIKLHDAYLSRKERNSKVSLFTYMKLFLLFGIDVNFAKNNRKRRVLAFTTKMLMKCLAIWKFLTIVPEAYIMLKSSKSSKTMVVISASNLVGYMMWNYTIKHQTKLIKTLNKLRKLKKLLEISPPRQVIKVCFVFFASVSISFICLYSYDYDVSKSKMVSEILTFTVVDLNDIHWSAALFSWHIYQFTWHYLSCFTCYFALFYAITCLCMTSVLREHAKVNSYIIKRGLTKLTSNSIIDDCLARYNLILRTFDSINSVLSFPIFLECCYTSCEMFWVMYKVSKESNEISVRHIFFLIINFILFTFIVFSAASVHEADKIAKKSNISVLRLLSDRNRKQDIEILSQMCYSPPLTLTGWGFFEFTRGLYLTALGCFVTYYLLIINL